MDSVHSSRAQIVATIGPSSWDEATLGMLMEHQMDVARLNFSWGDKTEHERTVSRIRCVAEGKGRRIPIIADLSGPRAQETGGHHFDATCQEMLTEKDLIDLDTCAALSVEYVAMSYVGCAGDIALLREEMGKRGMHAKVIAKIERAAALEHLDEVVSEADAVMVARGDLGNEVPLERIPFVQRAIIKKCKVARKPVITATQMMLSMVHNPVPTRAEVSDVTHAILDGSDAVMLSEETTEGRYPVETVAMMEKIVLEAEKHEHVHEHNLL